MPTSTLFKACGVLLLAAHSAFGAFGYSRAITIDHTKVPSTQSSFPVLISSGSAFSPSLATLANGGNVTSSSGYDIGFYTGSDCSTGKLNWETEDYSATTGVSRYWVNITSLSSSVDTLIYLCYGDASITTDQSNKTAVWDSNYKAVWHLPNGSSLTANDSTGVNNGSVVGTVTAAAGQIDGGANNVTAGGNGIRANDNASLRIASKITISAWINQASRNANGAILLQKRNATIPNTDENYAFYMDGSGIMGFQFNTTNTDPGYQSFSDTGTAISLNTWTYATVTVDETAGTKLSFYKNGALNSTPAYSGNMPSSGTGPIQMTNYDQFTGPPDRAFQINGTMDEVRISNITRTAGWITAEYNNQFSPPTFYSVGAEVHIFNSPFSRGISIQGGRANINGGKVNIQ